MSRDGLLSLSKDAALSFVTLQNDGLARAGENREEDRWNACA